MQALGMQDIGENKKVRGEAKESLRASIEFITFGHIRGWEG